MIDIQTLNKAWALLDARERRAAWVVLCIIVMGALSSAIMVGSVMPFLSVLADSSRIETTPALAWAFNSLGFTTNYGFLISLGLTSFAVIVLSSMIQIARIWAVSRFTMMLIHSISKRLLSSYLFQPYVFFICRHSGKMSTLVLSETERAVQQFLRPTAELVTALLTIIAILLLLLWVDPVVATFTFILLGGIYFVIYIFTRRHLRRLGQERLDANFSRFRLVNETFAGIKDIKLLGRELAYVERFESPSLKVARADISYAVISQVPQFALQAIALGGVILLCLLILDPAAVDSQTTLGSLIPTIGVFAFAGQRLMPELSKLYQSFAQIQAGTAALENVYADFVLHERQAVPESKSIDTVNLRKCIRLSEVSYSYPNSEQAGLRGISFTIQAGEKIGIVGSTGAGKTTLADIILGLLEVGQGQIIVDDTVITGNKRRAWRHNVAYVPQDIFLIDSSITENIALGIRPEEINFLQVQRAARIAKIDHFINEDLPEGYQTQVGERGVRLSGGQRQRIGIARAMYHMADLVVFDEATSALDNLTETDVMDAIDNLPGDMTVIMIAHRLSTVKRCDRIIVLDKGCVVGCDTWEGLMKENLVFQRFARLNEKI